jgi:hypothetical protein
VLLTNQFALPAATICALYESRWQVELFFKWIKQHLRIKQFYGTSENASQIWIAVSAYVLVAIVKKRLGLDASLYTLPQILSVTLFERMFGGNLKRSSANGKRGNVPLVHPSSNVPFGRSETMQIAWQRQSANCPGEQNC